MIVRHADADADAAACAEIYAPMVRDSPVSFEEDPPAASELARRIEQVSRRYPWLVADEAGRIVGYAYGCEHRTRVAYRWAVDVAVYVSVAERRHGVGRALYESLLPLLTRQGFRSACAGITLPNPASVALHERCGFTPVGVFRAIGWKAGAWRDVGWWQRELGAPDSAGDRPREPVSPVRLETS